MENKRKQPFGKSFDGKQEETTFWENVDENNSFKKR